MKKSITAFLSVAIIAIGSFIASSCSKSQTEVNSFITSLNNYQQSIKQAGSAQELSEIDASFVAEVQKYSSSDVKLTEADREALTKAIGQLGETTNAKMGELSGGKAPLSDEQLQQRLDAFKAAIDRCQTLGDVVTVGL